MPFGDGTGPEGTGPMTGRAAGFCAGYPVPGYMNPVGRRGYWGFGRGRGGGQGRRNWFYATGFPGWARAPLGYPAWGGPANPYTNPPFVPEITPEQELAGLKQQAEHVQNTLEEINKRIEKLQADSKK
jgi:hypothetical protein